jgi:hypothetical protein
MLALLASCTQLTQPPQAEVTDEVTETPLEPRFDDAIRAAASTDGTTFSCGGVGERPCGADKKCFRENGNLCEDSG